MQQLVLDVIRENHKLVFIDETGAHGFDFTKDGTARYFIVTAILIHPDSYDNINNAIDLIRDKHMNGRELKSSVIGNDFVKRIHILQEIANLDFYFLTYIIDKPKIHIDSPLQYKKTFYKFANNLLHDDLRKNYQSFDIYSDEIGTKDYMLSFVEYVKGKNGRRKNISFEFLKSHESNLIQLADIVCGTIGKIYNSNDNNNKENVFMRYLRDKRLSFEVYPKNYKNYLVDASITKHEDYDEVVAEYCLNRILNYINTNKDNTVPEIIHQIYVLETLLYTLQFRNDTEYIKADSFIKALNRIYGTNYSRPTFSRDIIGKLRSQGIILSSGTQGYKIPVNIEEVYKYTNHTMHLIVPMIDRLKKCRDNLLLATSKKYDMLDIEEYKEFKIFLDEIYMKEL